MFRGFAVRDEAVAGEYGAKTTMSGHEVARTGGPPQQGEPKIRLESLAPHLSVFQYYLCVQCLM